MKEEKVIPPESPILKGVITEITDDGNYGKINCGSGQIFTFDANQLDPNYVPVLKDIVEFSLVEDAPFAIHLYHRSRASGSSDSASVDLRVACPHCGKPIIPKAKVVNGQVSGTYCPECQKLIEKADKPPKVSFTIWAVAIICALIVGVIVGSALTP